MAGQDVDDVDQPAGQAAEFPVSQPDSPVDHRPAGTGECAGQPADTLFADAGDDADPFRWPVRDGPPQGGQPLEVAVEVRAGSTRSSAKEVRATASSSAASVPGTMGSHSSARAAIRVRTDSLPGAVDGGPATP